MTGLEELEDLMRTIDEEEAPQVKRVLVRLLHQDETGSPPFRQFGARGVDSNRQALRLAARGELGTTDAAIVRMLTALFDEPTPQHDAMTTVLEQYRRYVEDAVGSDSDSDSD